MSKQDEWELERLKSALRESVVIGVTGRRGQGKTLFASFLCLDAHVHGRQVLHNGPLNFGRKVAIEELVQLPENLRDAIVFLDEIPVILSNRRSATFASYVMNTLLTQLRKRAMSLIWTAQFESQVDVNVRYQTDIGISCKSENNGRTVTWEAIDSQGRWSQRPRGAASIMPEDYRRKMWGRLHRGELMFPYFDTGVVVDPYEVIGLTREKIMAGARTDQDLADVEWIQAIVEELRAEGHEWVSPGQLSLRLKHERDPKKRRIISPQNVGQLLRQIGLLPTRKSDGMYYQLEPPV